VLGRWERYGYFVVGVNNLIMELFHLDNALTNHKLIDYEAMDIAQLNEAKLIGERNNIALPTMLLQHKYEAYQHRSVFYVLKGLDGYSFEDKHFITDWLRYICYIDFGTMESFLAYFLDEVPISNMRGNKFLNEKLKVFQFDSTNESLNKTLNTLFESVMTVSELNINGERLNYYIKESTTLIEIICRQKLPYPLFNAIIKYWNRYILQTFITQNNELSNK
jgi:hypothetical protein